MSLKEYIFNKITKMPIWLNILLLRFNCVSKFIYGQAYLDYKNGLYNNAIKQGGYERQLLELLRVAINDVVYYSERYQINDVKSLDDFKNNFEFIDKDIVMAQWNKFVNSNVELLQYAKGTTGGTSGKPMQLLMPKNRFIVELASLHYYWEKFGFCFSSRAVLRNHKLDSGFIVNPIMKEYIFDGFTLTDELFSILYSTMKKYKITYLQCYPSSGYEFANYLKRNKLDTKFIKAFFVSSENVLDHQRDIVKQLGINYFSLYGHSEKLVMAGNCPYSDYYHIMPGYGYVELVDQADKIINEEGVLGEIVGTTYRNKGFPLIRYKTGDYSEYVYIDCKCGYKGMALNKIHGRWDGDKIFNKDGSFVTTTALNLHNDLYSVIEGLQYIQNEKGELLVNIVPGESFDCTHEMRIYEHYNEKMNGDTHIEVCRVDSLKRQSNGKFILLLSTVN